MHGANFTCDAKWQPHGMDPSMPTRRLCWGPFHVHNTLCITIVVHETFVLPRRSFVSPCFPDICESMQAQFVGERARCGSCATYTFNVLYCATNCRCAVWIPNSTGSTHTKWTGSTAVHEPPSASHVSWAVSICSIHTVRHSPTAEEV